MDDRYIERGLLFQHTAARRRLAVTAATSTTARRFQHTAARRRLGSDDFYVEVCFDRFQHTAARRRLA